MKGHDRYFHLRLRCMYLATWMIKVPVQETVRYINDLSPSSGLVHCLRSGLACFLQIDRLDVKTHRVYLLTPGSVNPHRFRSPYQVVEWCNVMPLLWLVSGGKQGDITTDIITLVIIVKLLSSVYNVSSLLSSNLSTSLSLLKTCLFSWS